MSFTNHASGILIIININFVFIQFTCEFDTNPIAWYTLVIYLSRKVDISLQRPSGYASKLTHRAQGSNLTSRNKLNGILLTFLAVVALIVVMIISNHFLYIFKYYVINKS